MNAAIGYVRVSTEEQAATGVSLSAQADRIAAYCQMAGTELVGVIRDEGVSGSIPLADRDGGRELLKRLRRDHIGNVVALKLDRVFRDAEDALRQTREWDKAGVALHLVDLGGSTLNSKSATGRMFLTMLAAFAELERNLTRERTAAALGHKKKNGEVYGRVPFGFVRQGDRLIPDAGQQEVIAAIQSWRRDGETLQRIADRLNHSGVATARNGKWYASTVKAILDNDLHDSCVTST